MRRALLQFSLGILIFSFISCSKSIVSNKSQKIDLAVIKTNYIIGKWKLIDRFDVDSLGRKLEEKAFFESFNEFGSNEKSISNEKRIPETYLSFNSQGEGFTDDLAYGFNYYLTDSTLQMGRKYKLIQLDDSVLTLMEDGSSELMSLSGGLGLDIFERVNSNDFPSNRFNMKKLIIGKWVGDYIIPVEVNGNAAYEDKESIKDTLGVKQKNEMFFNFKAEKFEMGQANTEGVAGLFKYDIADSMINVEGSHVFTILEITADSLSLLGIHSPETDSRYIWKMFRTKQD
jgi:hypothetical protein